MILDSGFDGDDTFYSWMLIGLIGIDRIDWCSFSLDSSGKHFMYVLDKNILTVNPMGTRNGYFISIWWVKPFRTDFSVCSFVVLYCHLSRVRRGVGQKNSLAILNIWIVSYFHVRIVYSRPYGMYFSHWWIQYGCLL